jgi:ectoine hydroxylase-related dioxygenase (phytanoyl-CoA dioxygenase family)
MAESTGIQDQLAFYQENGYLVVPDALSAPQIDLLNELTDRSLAADRALWIEREEGHSRLNVHILMAHEEFDLTMRPPALLELMEAILGPDICAEEHSMRIRDPNPDKPGWCHWHRDEIGPPWEPPYYTRYLSVVFYLSDVDDTTHTFSVLPGSAPPQERPPLESYDLSRAHHITGARGTAVLFNAALFHAGNVRTTSSERRTIHIYCGRSTDRYLSNYTVFPRRLRQAGDEAVRHYYSRPNAITQLMIDHF